MKLTLARNLGRADAKRLGIEKVADAQRGKSVTIKDEATLNEFRQRGLVVETKADGTVVAAAEAGEAPDFDNMTLAELRDFAHEKGIEGVTTTMNKEDTVKAVKKGFKTVR